jgi:hypothetical protein
MTAFMVTLASHRQRKVKPVDVDLPDGYRWATAEETEDWENVPGIIVVPRTHDASGTPYTHSEADLAVPITGGER